MLRFFPLTLLVSLALSACTSLPSNGPRGKDILEGAHAVNAASPYDVVEVTPAVASVLSRSDGQKRSGSFASLPRASSGEIGIGDSVAITIYEAAGGGLFSTQGDPSNASSARVALPVQTVSKSGTISVPYAGSIKAAGRSPEQVQKIIQSRLANRAIEPQAIVTVSNNQSRLVSVSGEAQQGGRFPLSNNGERVLDAIAFTGGLRGQTFETRVRLTRGSRSADLPMQRLASTPAENVVLQPRDQIFLYKSTQSYSVLGASFSNAQVDFKADNMSLAEAIARGGGLDDTRADPAAVFVYRFENPKLFHAVSGKFGGEGPVPVIYRLNMRQPASILSAQRFQIKDKDVLYLANSPSDELSKFLRLLNLGTTSSANTVTVARVLN